MQEIGMQPDMWTTVSYYGARPWRELRHQEPPKTIVELLDHTDEALLARKRKTEAAKSTREKSQILKTSPGLQLILSSLLCCFFCEFHEEVQCFIIIIAHLL